MQITFYGHSCFLVECDGQKILFDPFITGNDATKGLVDLMQIEADYVLLSHGHQDHTLDAETVAKQNGAAIIANYEIAIKYQNKGVENTIPMNHGGTVMLKNDVTVKMVNAVHTSSFDDGSYAGQPAGFVVKTSTQSFYFSGDTALHYDMKLIGEAGGVDFAFLCLGDHFTMGYKDAILAAKFVGTTNVIAMHFDTFPPIKIDPIKVENAFKDQKMTCKIPHINETFTL